MTPPTNGALRPNDIHGPTSSTHRPANQLAQLQGYGDKLVVAAVERRGQLHALAHHDARMVHLVPMRLAEVPRIQYVVQCAWRSEDQNTA